MNGFFHPTLMHNVTIRGSNTFTKGTSIFRSTFTSFHPIPPDVPIFG